MTTLVVARYDENISWTRDFPHVVIINKGAPVVLEREAHEVIETDNVGREAHAYLAYITTRYETLPDHVVFLQGNPFIHNADINVLLRDVETFGYTKNWLDTLLWGIAAPHPHFNLKEWNGRVLGHPHLTYKAWCEEFLGEYAGILEVYPAAQYGISRERIRRHPRAFYERLLKECSYDNAPQEAHFLERAWIAIFGVHETERFPRIWK